MASELNTNDGARVDPGAGLGGLTLAELLPQAWRLLEDGARRSRAAFHTPALATLGPHGVMQRTVVLRRVEPEQRLLICHTDRRSAKVRELRQHGLAHWLFYDRDLKLQLRIAGSTKVHTDDALAEAAWQRSAVRSRACYAATVTPGSVVAQPPAAPRPGAGQDALARQHFAAVVCKVACLEWLYLCGDGHRRARFAWRDDALDDAEWIAP